MKKAAQEVFDLDRIHALDHRTVLVHGLACTPEAVVSDQPAPCSSSFSALRRTSFSSTDRPRLRLSIRSTPVILGSDSPLTAAGDLLDEIRLRSQRRSASMPTRIYAMVTNRAAEVLRLRRGEGTLKPGSVADVLVVRDTGLSPAETLAAADHRTD